MLVNLEHGLKQIDQEMLTFILDLKDITVKLILTKADKLIHPEDILNRSTTIATLAKSLDSSHNLHSHVHVSSSKSLWGIPVLKHALMETLHNA
jgi:GTP-binding protein EngB required for normal cell division